MIQANAKCINNGKKLNETIGVLNNILKVVVSEEIEIVDGNNQPSKRWFFTGKLTGQKQDSDTGGKDRYGNTQSNNNRDQLSMNTGGALRDDGSTTSGGGINSLNRGGVDQFGNTIGGSGALRDDGSTTAGGGINSLNKGSGVAGGMADDGQTAEQSRTNFLANQQRAADTTPPPLPGAPPLGGGGKTSQAQRAPQRRSTTGNTTAQSTTTPATEASAPTPAPTPASDPITSDLSGNVDAGSKARRAMAEADAEMVVNKLTHQLYDAKQDDKMRYDWEENRWVYKEFGDPDSDRVTALKGRLDSARAYLERLKAGQ